MEAELCRELVSATPDAILYADREGIIRLWNRGAETLFGFTAAEALGSSLDLIIPVPLRERHWQGYRRVMEGGASLYATRLLTVPALTRSGERLKVAFSISLHCDSRGLPTGISAILRKEESGT